jgi:hypothetical protein
MDSLARRTIASHYVPKELRRKRHKLTLEPGRKTLTRSTRGTGNIRKKECFRGAQLSSSVIFDDFGYYYLFIFDVFERFFMILGYYNLCIFGVFERFLMILGYYYLCIFCVFVRFLMILGYYYLCIFGVFE